MSKKIEAYMKKYTQQQADLANLQTQRGQLTEKLQGLQASLDDAADMDTFRRIRAEIQDISETIDFLDKKISKYNLNMSRNEAMDAWNDYAANYNKEFAKKINALERARKDVEAAFIAALKIQNEALQVREAVAGLAGIASVDGYHGDPLPDFRMDTLPDRGHRVPVNIQIPELAYLIATGSWPSPAEGIHDDNRESRASDTVGDIVIRHKPVDKLQFV